MMNIKSMKAASTTVVLVLLLVSVLSTSVYGFYTVVDTMVTIEPVKPSEEVVVYRLDATEVNQIASNIEEVKQEASRQAEDLKDIKRLTDQIVPEKQGTIAESKPIVTSRSMMTSRRSSVFSMDLRIGSGVAAAELNEVLKNTGLEGLGEAFILAEINYNVNALFLVALAAHESEWGKSNFAKERNNLFGFMSYDSNLNATKKFESKEECIQVVAKHLSEHYLTEGGKYHNGYTLASINEKYASDNGWYKKVGQTMLSLHTKIEKLK